MGRNHDPLSPFEYSPAIEMPGGPVVVIQREPERRPMVSAPETRQLTGSFGGLQNYTPANEMGPANENVSIIHRIPANRRLFSPPVRVDLDRLRVACQALAHIAMPEVESRVSENYELGGMKISFDGVQTIWCEATDREKHGLVILSCTTTGPSSPWSCIIPPTATARALSSLRSGIIEMAPADRFLVGPQAFPMLEGGQKFPPRPPRPIDLDGVREEKETAFQCVVRREDLKTVLKSLSSVIDVKNIRSNMRHIYVGPEERMMAGSTSKNEAAVFLRVDVRSKPRLEHPKAFHLPLDVARAAYLLGDDNALLVGGHQTVVLSMTKKGELYIGGLESQDHFIRIEPQIQIGVARFTDIMTEVVNTATVKRDEFVAALTRATEIHRDNLAEGFVNLYFGDGAVVATSSIRLETDAIREDMERNVAYVRANTPSMFTRTMVYRPDLLLALLAHIEGPEVTLGYPKNASGRDALTLSGADDRRRAMLMPIVNHNNDTPEEDCNAGAC